MNRHLAITATVLAIAYAAVTVASGYADRQAYAKERIAIAAERTAEATAQIAKERELQNRIIAARADECAVVEPMAGPLIEVEERTELTNTAGTRVCQAEGRFLYSYNCSLEEAEADETIYRGGLNVASADGVEFCQSCRQGQIISGNANAAYLLSTNASAFVRCVCGYR